MSPAELDNLLEALEELRGVLIDIRSQLRSGNDLRALQGPGDVRVVSGLVFWSVVAVGSSLMLGAGCCFAWLANR